MKRSLVLVGLVGVLACLVASGCRSGEKERSTVTFHAEGVHEGINAVLGQVTKPTDKYGMEIAVDQLWRALEYLPQRVEKNRATVTNPDQRKATAVEAKTLFAEIRPALLSMQFNATEMKTKLGQLSAIVDKVQK